uniref:Gfo/Idh/MocA-like oxidoreductase N-terminal domain-containing protein n=1 Tax=Fibrocapsa japonica TaxID=94617 RepID=A0A7S2V6L1_9STRA|eukprot:CAMPEP_0113943702 /NCGR_PEP_ID=MMETSP1339-20121228/26979_1 /TAXON_ID=94617 /ORGANISM="Fibrocapsa japonica" /LENGTH=403 /DNA_ID=CAMNT_0000948643 /DNA_START=71 /DNA_END=1282 /DNA_ORIENTATION=+ /assembly_acc=CAM_ASM_000762
MSSTKVGFALLGAGGIHFGCSEGPWNHSARLELMHDVECVAIINRTESRALAALEDRQANSPNKKVWEKTKIFDSLDVFLQDESKAKCSAIFIGTTANIRGGTQPPLDVELRCAEAGLHIFMDKPVTLRPLPEVEDLSRRLAKYQKDKNLVMQVGYMLRYSPLVVKALELLEGAHIAMVMARYHATYSNIEKRFVWDINESGGALVDQGGHLIDLMRLFCGDVDLTSIAAVSVDHSYSLEALPDPPLAEHTVPESNRIDRATSGTFKFMSGAIGSVCHSLLLQDVGYETELEIIADGIRIIIQDFYKGNGKLLMRRPGQPETIEVATDDVPIQDCFVGELSAFVEAVRAKVSGKEVDICTPPIRSPVSDAIETYRVAKLITEKASACNTKNSKKRKNCMLVVG